MDNLYAITATVTTSPWSPPRSEDRVLSPSGMCLNFMCGHELDEETGMCLLAPDELPHLTKAETP